MCLCVRFLCIKFAKLHSWVGENIVPRNVMTLLVGGKLCRVIALVVEEKLCHVTLLVGEKLCARNVIK